MQRQRKCEQEPVPAIPSVDPNHNAPQGQCCRRGTKLFAKNLS